MNDTLMSGRISIVSNIPIGSYDVQITNNEDTITLTNGFTINSPSISSITPKSGKRGETVIMYITTSNFSFPLSNDIYFYQEGSSNYNNVQVTEPHRRINDSVWQTNVIIAEEASAGLYTLRINTDSFILKNAFTVTGAPARPITNITPNSAKQGNTLNISITCANTSFINNPPYGISAGLTRNGSNTTDTNVRILATHITSYTTFDATVVIYPNAPLGLYDISYSYFYRENLITKSYGGTKTNAFTVTPSTGIKEVDLKATKIYPNPASKQVTIESKQNIENIMVFDVTGKEMAHKTPERETQMYELNLTDLAIPKGIYFIKVVSHDGSVTKKIIIE
ncbi:MAG: T9SS type A sorting domain-containing protein [Bacteroidota bacterium]